MDEEGDPDEAFSLPAADLREIAQVLPLCETAPSLRSLSLHGNEITSLTGLGAFTRLRCLNLAANAIDALSGLHQLPGLTALDLSSNRLRSLAGLQGLASLQRLSVAHNFLASLEGLSGPAGGPSTPRVQCEPERAVPVTACSRTSGLSCLISGSRLSAGPCASLVFLNARNNQLADLADLSHLAPCTALRELVLSGGTPGNELAQLPNLRAAAAFALPQVRLATGRPVPAFTVAPSTLASCAERHCFSLPQSPMELVCWCLPEHVFATPQVQLLDGVSLEPERARQSGLPQHLAAARLTAFQPHRHAHGLWPGSPRQLQGAPPGQQQPGSPCCQEALEAVVARLAPLLAQQQQPHHLQPRSAQAQPSQVLDTQQPQPQQCQGPQQAAQDQPRRQAQADTCSTASQCTLVTPPVTASCSVHTEPDPAVRRLRELTEDQQALQEQLAGLRRQHSEQGAQLQQALAAQHVLQEEAASARGANAVLEHQVRLAEQASCTIDANVSAAACLGGLACPPPHKHTVDVMSVTAQCRLDQ